MKKRIFISYQRQQQPLIEELAAALTKTDAYDVWFDQELQGGQKWWEEIIRRIENADVVILALSQSYFASDYCKREWQYAHDRNKVLIPIKIDSALPYADIPHDISKWQITVYDGQDGQFQKLDTAIRAVVSGKPPLAINRRLLAAIGLALVVMVGLVVYLAANSRLNSADGKPTSVPASVPEGAYNFTLIYGEMNSLSLKIEGDSNLSNLTLETPRGTIALMDNFPSLSTMSGVAAVRSCFRFIREGTTPALPLGCNRSSTFEKILSGDAVFWYDADTKVYQDIALKYRGGSVGSPCSHANGSGRCEMSRQININE